MVPALLALLAFANTLENAFVYDDRDLIVQNPSVHALGELPEAFTRPMWSFRTSAATNYYRPLPVAVYTLLWAGGGGAPWPFHLLNVLLHAANATLAAALVFRLSRKRALAVAAGALFAVHPLGSEAVAWASGLPELMYAAAVLGFLHLHLSSRRLLAGGALLVGLLSKETAAAALPLAFLLDWTGKGDVGRALRRTAPYLIPLTVVLALRLSVLGGLVPRAGGALDPAEALAAVPRMLAAYLGLLVAPVGLAAHHALPRWTDLHVLVGCTVALGLFLLRPRRSVPLGLCLLPLLPVLYVPFLGVSPLAERYAYLPIAGMVWIVCDLLGRHGARSLAALATVLVLAGGMATVVRNRVWRDERTLAESMLRADPGAQPGYLMLAKWHWDRGDKEAAVEVFERGLAWLPEDRELAASLLVARWSQGTVPPDEAIPALETLSAERPGDAMLHFNLGEAYLRMERTEDAEASFARALEARSTCPECLVGRGVAAGRRGDHRLAADFARQALVLSPGDVPALRQLGVSLLRLGDAGGAVDALEEAVRGAPEDAEVWNALGAAYASANRPNEAEGAWTRAIGLDPGQENARRNLERLRAR
ncbi:MAG TPA: tetratricopeptide repeat protein [Candidatus Polarisedimenticolaceae bacterium]|nr:tetratricopeptide repeat protein [Candidatus Polarisedimenticolaceae bacterium]